MKFAKRLLMVAGAVALAGIVSVALVPRAAHAIVSTLVTVVNTPNVKIANTPVPVTGSVAVSSMPAIAIGGNVNSTVSNTATNPVPTQAVDNPAQQPFQWESFGATNPDQFSFSVPLGKILVIEEVNIACIEPQGSAYPTDYRVTTTAGGSSGTYLLPPVVIGGSEVMTNQLTRIYADGGSTVYFGAGAGTPAGSSCGASVSGHLVNKI